MEFASLNWVWWFNHLCLLEPIGYIPPVEYEEAYWRERENKPALAPLKEPSLRETRCGSFSRA